MAGGHVNRALLQQYYQNPGDTYDDAMTEGAYEVLAQQIDDNWDEYAAHRVAPEIDHPDGSVTGRKIRNGTITADKFVPGALTNETQNALRITQLENNFGAHVAKSVTDAGGVHGLQVETGTFTPGFSGATGTDYTLQEGRYVRFGNLVYFSIRIVLSQKGSIPGEVSIIGLPFVATNTYISVSVGHYSGLNLPSPYSGVKAYIYPVSPAIRLRKTRNTDTSPLVDTDITNNAQFMVSGVYQI